MREVQAALGYFLHFSFTDTENMDIDELMSFYEIAKEMAKEAAR